MFHELKEMWRYGKGRLFLIVSALFVLTDAVYVVIAATGYQLEIEVLAIVCGAFVIAWLITMIHYFIDIRTLFRKEEPYPRE